MSSVRLPLNFPLMEEESRAPTDEESICFAKNEKKKGDRNGNLIKKLWM